MLSGLSLFLRKSEPEWHLSIRNSIPHETWTKMWKKTTHRIEIRLVSCVALPFSILCVAISPQYLLFGPNGSGVWKDRHRIVQTTLFVLVHPLGIQCLFYIQTAS